MASNFSQYLRLNIHTSVGMRQLYLVLFKIGTNPFMATLLIGYPFVSRKEFNKSKVKCSMLVDSRRAQFYREFSVRK